MSDAQANDDKLVTLISDLLDGNLSDDDAARLAAMLRDDPAVARQYAQLLSLHAMLETELDSQLPEIPPSFDATIAPSNDAVQSGPAGMWRHGLSFFARRTPFSIVVAALVIGMLVTAMAFMVPPFYKQMGRGPDIDINRVGVAELTDLHEAVWAAGQVGTQVGAHWIAGQRLELRSGLAQFQLSDGARIVAEGPTILSVDGVSQISLQRGRLTARVESKAAGFTVVTPQVTVVDLGTEFGVNVHGDKTAEVYVFEGQVEARIADRAGGDIVLQQIAKGSGLRVDGATGRTESTTAQRSRFVREIPHWKAIRVVNASFEEPTLNNGEAWRSDVAGWTSSQADHFGVSSFGGQFSQPTPNGVQTAFLNEGTLSQELAETLQPGTKYRLVVWVGNRPGPNSPNYSLELWAGEEKLAESHNEIMPEKGRFGRVLVIHETADDHAESFGQPLKIVLRSHGSLATRTQNHFDLVQLWKFPPPASDDVPSD